jgi:DnaJ-class molecular chaperone
MYKHLCPRCRGDGKVAIMSNTRLGDMINIECGVCLGTGYYWDYNPKEDDV